MTATNPIFLHLMSKYKELSDAGLARTKEAGDLFIEMMRYAPPEYQKVAHDIAVEMGLMPATPDGYSDDGEPLYIVENICDRIGVDPADVPSEVLAHAHTGNFHRAH